MKVFTYSEARQRLADVLREAGRAGQVQIRRRDGQVFTLRPEESVGSPLDVAGVKTDLAEHDIIDLVRESRRSTGRFLRRPANKALQPTSRRRKKSTRAQTARG